VSVAITILLILASTTGVLFLITRLPGFASSLQRPTYPFNDSALGWALPVLLHQGEHGSVVFIHRRIGSEFQYIEPLRQFLDGARVPYVVVPTEDELTTRFILVDFGTDVDRAQEVGLDLLDRVFELPEEEFHLYFQGRFDPRPRLTSEL
jgi:hypothetical protein